MKSIQSDVEFICKQNKKKTNTQRISWIDVCKGILIILMVTGHIPNIVHRLGNELGIFSYWFLFVSFYGCFFMQTFFILTALTTNFNIPFKPFLLKQIKTIIIPYVCFCFISKVVGFLLWKETLFDNVHGQSIFFLIEGFWFLTALFIAKILYWFIRKLPTDFYSFVGCISLMLVGFLITLHYSKEIDPGHFNNYFHYRNALCMTIFLWFGEFVKDKITIKFLKWSSILFMASYVITFIIKYKTNLFIENFTPIEYSHTVKINSIWQVFSYLFYTISGSSLAILIAMYIKKNHALEFLGKNSIVIYCTHFTFINIYARIFANLFGNSLIISFIYFTLIIICTLLSTVLLAKIFKYKPFNYILGKF